MQRYLLRTDAGNAIMVRQSERKHKAAQTTIPDADTMRTIIATVVAVITALLLSNFTKPTPITVTHNLEQAITEHVSAAPAEAVATPEPTAADKPVPEKVAVQPTAVAPQAAPASTCAAEITKYSNWNQSVAYNVMIAESSGDAGTHNDDPSTGDYSIGCFQINLLGEANLYSKHRVSAQLGYAGAVDRAQLTTWLKDPANNVAVANKLYVLAGQWSDWKYTCQTKVNCY